MSRKPFLIQDEALAAISDRITDLMARIDALINAPNAADETRLLDDIDTMKRDLNAELIARHPPPGWEELERRAERINH